MELGIHFVNFNVAGGPHALGPTMAATARAAEQGGATMFTLADHPFQMDTLLTAEDPFLEGYTSELAVRYWTVLPQRFYRVRCDANCRSLRGVPTVVAAGDRVACGDVATAAAARL